MRQAKPTNRVNTNEISRMCCGSRVSPQPSRKFRLLIRKISNLLLELLS